MANKIDIKKELNLEQIPSLIDSVIKAMNELYESTMKVNGAIEKNEKANEEGNDALKKKKTAITELDKLQKRNLTLANKLIALESETAQEVANNTVAIQKKNKALKDNARASKAASDSLLKDRQELSRLTQQYLLASKAVQGNLVPQIKKLNDSIKKQESAIGNNTRRVGGYADGIKSAAGQLIGFTGGAGAAIAIIRKLGEAFEEAREDVILFEKEFATVLTLLDESQKIEFGSVLEDAAVNIMAKYGLTIEDVNQSLFDVISSGVDASDAVSVLDQSAQLAIASNADLSSVINGATTVMNAYGSKAGSTAEILNAFFAAQVKGKTTVEAISSNIGKLASSAAAADIPINELLGTFAGLTKFLDGSEESATALTNVIKSIVAPSDEAAAKFKELGIETGITGLKQNELLPTILKIAEAYEADNDSLAELIPNIRAFKGIAGLTSETVAELEKNISDLNDTEASSLIVQNALNEQVSTRAQQLKQLESATKALNVERDKSFGLIKRLIANSREHRTERKLAEIQYRQDARASKEFRKEVEAEVKALEERGEVNVSYYEVYNRLKQEQIDKQKELNNEITSISIDDDLGAAPEDANIDFDALEKQQKAQKEITDGYLETEKTKRKEAKKTADIVDDIMKEEEAAFLRGVDVELTQERGVLDAKIDLTEEELELAQEKANELLRITKERVDQESAIEEEKRRLTQAIGNELFNFGQTIGDREIANLQTQLDEEGNITQEAADKIAEIKRKQAVTDKIQALFNIGISTAEGIASALKTPTLIPFIAALGAAQAETVLATPIPQFFKGTDSAPAGLAMVGERGTEKVINPDGSYFYTPNTATLMNLQGGAQVLTASETKQEHGNANNTGVESRLDKLIKKPTSSINISTKAITEVIQKGGTTTYITKRLKSV